MFVVFARLLCSSAAWSRSALLHTTSVRRLWLPLGAGRWLPVQFVGSRTTAQSVALLSNAAADAKKKNKPDIEVPQGLISAEQLEALTPEQCGIYLNRLSDEEKLKMHDDWKRMEAERHLKQYVNELPKEQRERLSKLPHSQQVLLSSKARVQKQFDEYVQSMSADKRVTFEKLPLAEQLERLEYSDATITSRQWLKEARDPVLIRTLDKYCQFGELRAAERVMEEVLDRQLKEPRSFARLMHLYADQKDYEGAAGLFEYVKTIRLPVSIEMYNNLMQLCNSIGYFRHIDGLFEELLQRKLLPNAETFAHLIDSHAINGNPQAAIEAWQQMEAQQIGASALTYIAILRCLDSAKDQRVDQFIERFKQAQIELDAAALAALAQSNPALAPKLTK